MRSSFTRGNLPLITWALLLLAAIAIVASNIANGEPWVRSNIFELLPASDYDPIQEQATRVVDAELGTRLLFFVGHADRDVAQQAADALGDALTASELLTAVTVRADATGYAAMAPFYYPYRSRLLSDAQREQIEADPAAVENTALAKLYSPFGAGGDVASDPFLLFADSLQAMLPEAGALQFSDGYLWAEKDGRSYVFVMAKLAAAGLSIAEQESLAEYVNAAIDELVTDQPALDIPKTGFPFYAHEATRSAKGEISTIGVGSLIGLLLLVVSTFRSLRPLALIIISILVGCLIALGVTLSVFGFVHLFTLVFGASLIGVSVDYSFHYIADDAFGDEQWTPARGLLNIFPGITLGLITSILAYLALTVAPFPGLQQLAIFSAAGLIGAYLTLIVITRFIRRRFNLRQQSAVLSLATRFLALWRGASTRAQLAVVGLGLLVVVVGGRSIEINDDVRMLQSQPPELVAQEAFIQDLLGLAQAGTFVLVRADDAESLLQQEEQIRVRLDGLLESDQLDSYQALSQWVPSKQRQDESRALYTELVETRLPGFLASVGADAETTATTTSEQLTDVPALSIPAWLSDEASSDFRRLWLDTGGNGVASMILLFGIDDVSALSDLTVINKGREISDLFGKYRTRVVQMLLAAYALILLLLAGRYGFARAGYVLAPPVLAGLLALALISLSGGLLNLFNFLALILVLGIGIDFTIFIAEARHEPTSTLLAITLSAITTILSFGLLALSSTFAVHSFGITVLIGIAFAYLLCPVALRARPGENAA